MKFPITEQILLETMEQEKDKEYRQEIYVFMRMAVKLVNKAYENAVEAIVTGIEKPSLFPTDKKAYIDDTRKTYAERNVEFTYSLQEVFEKIIDWGNQAYKQGEIDGYNKALQVAVTNSKIS